MEFKHTSVLLEETVDGLNIKEDGIYLDGTLGGGGHSELICSRLSDKGLLIGVDQDDDALNHAKDRLSKYSDRTAFVKSNFSDIKNVLKGLDIEKIDGVILDLGVSSYQLDNSERGFSYMQDAQLDMRMDRSRSLTARDVVNDYSYEELNKIIKVYGEDKWSSRIAKFIIEAREENPIETTHELVGIIEKAIPLKVRKKLNGHPAKRTFQAIRIEVNNELNILEETVKDITDVLNPGGRISIITFHSLEDRIIKFAYKELAKGCICPPQMPICTCNNEPKLKIITRKPLLPSEQELEENSRSRSAKLRVAQRV